MALESSLIITFSFIWVKCETRGRPGRCGVVFCWALYKKEVSHFADSEEKLSGYTERTVGKNSAEAILFFLLQNQLGKTENIRW